MYDWDPEGRLRTVRRADNGTTIATYLYDSLGRRLSRTVYQSNGVSVANVLRFVWDGDRVIEEWLMQPGDGPSGPGQLVAEYIWGAPAPNGLLAQRRDNAYPQVWDPNQALHLPWPSEVENDEWTYPLVDNRGNTRAVVSEVARVVERWAISATGLPLIVSGTDGSLTGLGDGLTAQWSGYGDALLTGHHWDPIARWHYAWHRWISPFTYGRFTSHSPLTYPVAELNYEWVRNNAWDYVDVDGLEPREVIMTKGGSIALIYHSVDDPAFTNVPIVTHIYGSNGYEVIPEGSYLVAGHGNERGVYHGGDAITDKSSRIRLEELVKDLRDAGHQPGKPVYLLACNTAKEDFIDRLSAALKSPVYGPNKYGYIGYKPTANFYAELGEPIHLGSMDSNKTKGRVLGEWEVLPHGADPNNPKTLAWDTRSPGFVRMAGSNYISYDARPYTPVLQPISNKQLSPWVRGNFFDRKVWIKK